MASPSRIATLATGFALVLLLAGAVRAGEGQAVAGTRRQAAVAFVDTLAQGHFNKAEAHFTGQMRQGLPPEKLRGLWGELVGRFGPFQGTGNTRTVDRGPYRVVVVRTDFKSRAIGIAVTFDPARRIAGMYIVPPP